MGDSTRGSVHVRRRLAIGAGTVRDRRPAATLGVGSVSTTTSTAVGSLTNVTRAVVAGLVNQGDDISSGWAISMPGTHPAATVKVSKIVTTIPLVCHTAGGHTQATSVVLHLPDTTVTIPANDTSWHFTSNPADVKGYEATAVVGSLCYQGALEASGNAKYAATLVSTNTKNLFAMRFHSVDARTNQAPYHPNPNTACSSSKQNPTALARCNAAWTPLTTALAIAPPSTSGTGSGGGTGSGSAGGHGQVSGPATGIITGITGTVAAANGTVTGVTGTVSGVTGTVAGVARGVVSSVASPLPVLGQAVGSALNGSDGAQQSAPAAAQPGAVSGATTLNPPPAPVPAPSQSTVLGPVPLPVPVIDSVAAGVGGALPWKWFVLLAIVDLGLVVGIVLRRRTAHRGVKQH